MSLPTKDKLMSGPALWNLTGETEENPLLHIDHIPARVNCRSLVGETSCTTEPDLHDSL